MEILAGSGCICTRGSVELCVPIPRPPPTARTGLLRSTPADQASRVLDQRAEQVAGLVVVAQDQVVNRVLDDEVIDHAAVLLARPVDAPLAFVAFDTRDGLVSASSADIRDNLYFIVHGGTTQRGSSNHSCIVFVSPKAVIIILF